MIEQQVIAKDNVGLGHQFQSPWRAHVTTHKSLALLYQRILHDGNLGRCSYVPLNALAVKRRLDLIMIITTQNHDHIIIMN
jgi:hypothetical protein